MNVNAIVLVSNPFVDAFTLSDLLGKLIFLSLVFLSIGCWNVLIYKSWLTFQARRNSRQFQKVFLSRSHTPLAIECNQAEVDSQPNCFLEIYVAMRQQALAILEKNRQYGRPIPDQEEAAPFLSRMDIDMLEGQLFGSINIEIRRLESHLYLLSTIVSLAPFLGLLGTVWGILTTFAQLQMQSGGNTHQMVLGGLSLALATTVLGLIDAIPALIGYNYLKNAIGEFQTEMEAFANQLLTAVEMQYRQVDLHHFSRESPSFLSSGVIYEPA